VSEGEAGRSIRCHAAVAPNRKQLCIQMFLRYFVGSKSKFSTVQGSKDNISRNFENNVTRNFRILFVTKYSCGE